MEQKPSEGKTSINQTESKGTTNGEVISISPASPDSATVYRTNMNHHANQGNPTSAAHKAAMNNRANQMNRNNPAYHSSRGGRRR